MKLSKYFPLLILVFFVAIYFKQLFLGFLPIPSDTIVGLYHPFRDSYAKDYPNGIPYKNFLITDPVRQQIPWRFLSISLEKKLELPLWNPYNFSGTPLLANFQSAVFYPFNILFFILPFSFAWSLLIVLEPFLAGLFLYLYLRNLSLHKPSALFGSVVFAFSGVCVAWMEWGTIVHTLLWLPLMLFSTDNLLAKKRKLPWLLLLIISLVSSFLAGHLQIFFYIFLVLVSYIFARLVQGKNLKNIYYFFLAFLIFGVITFPQWFSTVRFILLSARDIDQSYLQNPGWFIPWQNLIQFLIPDFFGNPTTLNYWGIWNYGEFIGYIGILPLIMAFYALFFRRDRKTLFFGIIFFLSLIFALPTFFAKIPFVFNFTFISSAQPTRILAITDFSIAILAAFGFDYFLKRKKEIIYPLGFVFLCFMSVWMFVFFGGKSILSLKDLTVAKSNLFFPTVIFASTLIVLLISVFIRNKNIKNFIYFLLFLIMAVDLFRFGWKFLPFTKQEYLFPQTKAISFLQKQKKPFRIMSLDSQLLPPNFSAMYRIESVEGYDPLYLKRYAELISAMERGKPDIHSPFGFNRIITLHNVSSNFINLLDVKYVMALSDLNDKNLNKVFQEGKTRIYKNKSSLPRAYFAENLEFANDKQDAINKLFAVKSFEKSVVVENGLGLERKYSVGKVKITDYQENKVTLETENSGNGFLFVSDTYYPTWHVKIDGKEDKIFLTDYNFQGVLVSGGKHVIVFYQSLF